MNKSIFLAIFLAFVLPSASNGMEIDVKPNSLKRTYSFQANQQFPSKKTKFQDTAITQRLSTPQSHLKYLQNAISSATKSILITSNGVDRQAFESAGLYDLLAQARSRGVRIYIYNIDSKAIDDETLLFFQDHDIQYAVTYTHAKLLAVDDKMVAIGSYNWLSKFSNWENSTLCLSGEESKSIIPLLWEDLKYYRNIQFGNEKQIIQYQRNPNNKNVDFWNLDPSTKLYYFHTLDHHRDFIADAFAKAKKTLIFCSPFINAKSGYQEDFQWELLSKTINRGVHIYFVCREQDQNLTSFKSYLGALLKSPFMHLIILPDIHQKTVIVDDITISEGSFNWLSASRDETSYYHNHEVTFMLNGGQAKELIQDFYKTPVGQEIIKTTSFAVPTNVIKPNIPSWQKNAKASLKPTNFEVFSGRSFGKDGFCVRFDKRDYLVDDNNQIIYFRTEKEAEQAANEFIQNFQSFRVEQETKAAPSTLNPQLNKFAERTNIVEPNVPFWQKKIKSSVDQETKAAASPLKPQLNKFAEPTNIIKPNIPSWQKNVNTSPKPTTVEIFSGRAFGKEGFCVRFNKRDYLVDANNQIIYFRTEKEAQKAANEFR